VGRWESGSTAPQPWQRPNLAITLKISVEQLDELLIEAGRDENLSDERLTYALEHPNAVDLVAVAHLRQRVEDLDERYDKAPPTSLFAEAGQCLGQVGFLRVHAPTNRVRRELFSVEAEAATLMGQLVWDASQRRDHTTARAYFDQAIEAARQLRDPAAEGRALLRKSFAALYGEKDPQTGLNLATQTADVGVHSGVGCGLRVWTGRGDTPGGCLIPGRG